MLCPQRFILYFEIFGRYWEKKMWWHSASGQLLLFTFVQIWFLTKKERGQKKRTGKWPRDLCYKWPLLWRHSTRSHSTRNLFSIAPNVVNLNQANWCWIKEARNQVRRLGFKSQSRRRLLPQKLCLILLGTLFSAHVLKIMLIQM